MIKLTLTIEQAEKGIRLSGKGGDIDLATKTECDFMKKLIKHIRSFNTTYKRVSGHSFSNIKIEKVNQ